MFSLEKFKRCYTHRRWDRKITLSQDHFQFGQSGTVLLLALTFRVTLTIKPCRQHALFLESKSSIWTNLTCLSVGQKTTDRCWMVLLSITSIWVRDHNNDRGVVKPGRPLLQPQMFYGGRISGGGALCCDNISSFSIALDISLSLSLFIFY